MRVIGYTRVSTEEQVASGGIRQSRTSQKWR